MWGSRRDRFELGAALATALIHVLPLEQLYPEIIEIVVLVGGWVGYLGYLLRFDRPRLLEMGFRRVGLRGSIAAALAFFAASVAAMAIWGFGAGTLRLHPHMAILAALYPLWGLVQQWLIQGVLARQLRVRFGALPTVLTTAAVFALLHVPVWWIVVGTFVLGLALTPIYLRWRNLWPLGFVHGWLAIPAYFWLAGTDPWATVTAG